MSKPREKINPNLEILIPKINIILPPYPFSVCRCLSIAVAILLLWFEFTGTHTTGLHEECFSSLLGSQTGCCWPIITCFAKEKRSGVLVIRDFLGGSAECQISVNTVLFLLEEQSSSLITGTIWLETSSPFLKGNATVFSIKLCLE